MAKTPTLKRRAPAAQPPHPNRIVALAYGDDRPAPIELARSAILRRLDEPEVFLYFLAMERVADLRDQLVATKGRRRAVLRRQLKVLEGRAAEARVEAGLP